MWNDEEGHKKIHLANWPSICMKKDYGGLGIPNLQDLNVCLIGSWIRRYIDGEGSLWKRVVDAKYNTKGPIFYAVKIHIPLSSGKELCGLLGLLDLVTNG
jgi:hypothetical protein